MEVEKLQCAEESSMMTKLVVSVLHSLRLHRFPAAVLVLAILQCLCVLPSAALPEASWSGVLRDNSGTPIAGVTVILSDGSGKSAYTTRTKADGGFAFSAIVPATYKVAVVTQQGIYQAPQSLVVSGRRRTQDKFAVVRSGCQSRPRAGANRDSFSGKRGRAPLSI